MSDDDPRDLPADVPSDKLFFRIGEAASLVGVEAHVLRYWESEFNLSTPRSSTGQRMYRRKDIADFLQIRRLLHEDGFTIAGARKAMQDGEIPQAAAESTSVDATRLREAADRVSALREQVRVMRDRCRAAGIAGSRGDG